MDQHNQKQQHISLAMSQHHHHQQQPMDQHQQEQHHKRAPSTTSLLCVSCTRPVTPCLLCSHPLPCCPCLTPFLWRACSKCKLSNPLLHKQRRLLGIPPASALPPSMLRRVIIGYIGRSSCTMAMHFHHQQLREGLVETPGETRCATEEGINCKCSSVCDAGYRIHPYLPFLLCEGRVTSMEFHGDKEMCNGKMCRNEEDPASFCDSCGNSCDSLCLNDHVDHDTDAALRRSEEQLLALHCPEALLSDLDKSAYPICCRVQRSSSIVHLGNNSTMDSIGACSTMKNGCYSISMLHLLNLPFVTEFDVWITNKIAEDHEKFTLKDLLTNVENFLSKQDQLLELKSSLVNAITAQKQVSIDCQGLPAIQSSVCMLQQFFADRIHERKVKFFTIAKPFSGILVQINVFLEFLYFWAYNVSRDPEYTIYRPATESPAKSRFSVEDVRALLKCWLLLYHEVVHATDLILTI